MTRTRWLWTSAAISAALAATTAAFVREADAGVGSFHLSRSNVMEQSHAWRLMMSINLPSAPGIAHPTFRFSFTPTVVYERSLVDGDRVVVNKTPLRNQTALIEMMEVDFADATGKIWKSTKFDFSLTRERGYQAGEYKLTVSGPGGSIGQGVDVVLDGENPVVDRRSMDFSKKQTGWDGGAESGIRPF